jgi:Na+/H+ antiporter NhaD/arsenite permease-like protein
MGGPGYPGYPTTPPKGLSITAMILGILALILVICGFWFPYPGILLGIAAAVVGFVALSKVKRREIAGRGMALTGVITGILAFVLGIVFAIGGIWFAGSDLGKCLTAANGDGTKMEQCVQDFQR